MHIWIIIDGNRRRAAQRNLSPREGHLTGAETLKTAVQLVFNRGIKTLTVYGFSTENRKRSQPEVDALLQIFTDYLIEMNEKLKNEDIKVNILGNISDFPPALHQAILNIQENTKNKTAHTFNLCLNYGGRADLVHAFQSLAQQVQQGKLQPTDIDEKLISHQLSTVGQDDPDLIIRTSGEQRLSGFLTRQSSYSELLFIDTFRPDFDEAILDKCLAEYEKRTRRFGR